MRFLTVTLGFCFSIGVFSTVIPLAAASEVDAEDRLAIVDKFVDATHVQQESLRGIQMEVNIDAKLPKLEKRGKLRALRTISRLGQITYKALGFSGDNTVKQEVITRYLTAESSARENGTIAITPDNYKFRYAGRIVQQGVTVQILEVTPRKKAVGLFKGQLWIDAATGMPIRESGQFVKTPSVFLKKIAFVRDYQLRDGIAFPTHIQSTVDTRIVGRAELDISFSNYSRQDEGSDVSNVTSESGAQAEPSLSNPPALSAPAAPSAAPAESAAPKPVGPEQSSSVSLQQRDSREPAGSDKNTSSGTANRTAL